MTMLSCFKQVRVDGGTRLGIDVDGETVLGRFDPGPAESDPILAWYVDIRCEGEHLPDDAESAQRWFLDNSELIRAALSALADEIRAGVDVDCWPLQWEATPIPPDVRVTIVCSAIRRVQAQQMAEQLRIIAGEWGNRIEDLAPLATARA